ncbi:50S ribosomal protein L11 [Candidatus Uhrbacteria bacterium]|nr:50S ribosomal protein L11 [Candidatus Uhrbacteria bacterium]
MAKKVKTTIKLQIPAGQANPAPPIGPALGQHGLNIAEFCKKFNDKTKGQIGDVLPVVITVFEDRSYDFITKTPPAAELIKKAMNLQKGSGKPQKEKIGKISRKQLEEIAKRKLPDLNTTRLQSAIRMMEGSAKSMGVEIVD